jgi:hypothetical protein
VVCPARSRVDQTASDAADEDVVVDEELDGVVELLLLGREHLVKLLGLGDSPGEAVEDEAVGALAVVFELVLDHVDHDVVAHETTLVHNLLGLDAKGSALADLFPEHVAGREVADAVFVLDPGCLRPLAWFVRKRRKASIRYRPNKWEQHHSPAPGGPIRTSLSC